MMGKYQPGSAPKFTRPASDAQLAAFYLLNWAKADLHLSGNESPSAEQIVARAHELSK